jgi:hypothetical protein
MANCSAPSTATSRKPAHTPIPKLPSLEHANLSCPKDYRKLWQYRSQKLREQLVKIRTKIFFALSAPFLCFFAFGVTDFGQKISSRRHPTRHGLLEGR